MNARVEQGRSLIGRWIGLLVVVFLAATWATCRLNAARLRLQPGQFDQSKPGIATGVPVDPASPSGFAESAKPVYMCTMPECNDQPSHDPNSRCPMCGMKREPIEMAGGGDTAELELGERARQLAEVATETVVPRQLFKHIRTVGKVAYDETRHRMVTAWMEGRIDTLFADYTGIVVKRGDHLVELYSPDLVTAQEELMAAMRGTQGLTSGSPAYKRAERLLRSAERQLELLGITPKQIAEIKASKQPATRLTIYAPIGGTVVRKPAMEGMHVETGAVLYEIADLDHVWVLADLYESDLPWISPLQPVSITADAMPGHIFEGRIAFVDPVVDRSTRTIKVRVNVPNGEGLLKPEMFVNVEVSAALADATSSAVPKAEGAYVCPMHPWESGDDIATCRVCRMARVPVTELPGFREPRAPSAVLAVSSEAVLQTGKRSLVYIETRPGAYLPAELEIGPLADDSEGRSYYPVQSGLTGGEQVVVRGNFAIDSQMQLSGRGSLFNAQAHNTPSDAGPAGGPQITCPVMGKAIVEDVFTDFHGIRVFFCCPPCIQTFEDAPETYLPKLPTGMQEKIKTAAGIQTLCPVMGKAIVEDVFTDFHGIRVYFCCPPCIQKFEDTPEAYLPELPARLAEKIKAAMNRDKEQDHG